MHRREPDSSTWTSSRATTPASARSRCGRQWSATELPVVAFIALEDPLSDLLDPVPSPSLTDWRGFTTMTVGVVTEVVGAKTAGAETTLLGVVEVEVRGAADSGTPLRWTWSDGGTSVAELPACKTSNATNPAVATARPPSQSIHIDERTPRHLINIWVRNRIPRWSRSTSSSPHCRAMQSTHARARWKPTRARYLTKDKLS